MEKREARDVTQKIPTFDDVSQAAERIAGTARHTPLLEFENLNARAGAGS